jgi:hypothetical protein
LGRSKRGSRMLHIKRELRSIETFSYEVLSVFG